MDKILFIDTETGGIDPRKYSLLSMAFAVWQDFKVLGSIEILINDGKLVTTPKALKINKINIAEHKRKAVTPKEAIALMDTFFDQYFPSDEKITLAGHNINFDVSFLKTFLEKNNYNFANRFSHRYIDTFPLLYYLYLSGKLKHKTLSSEEAFEYFKIKVKNRHSALGDVMATAELFSALIKKNNIKKKVPESRSPNKTLFK